MQRRPGSLVPPRRPDRPFFLVGEEPEAPLPVPLPFEELLLDELLEALVLFDLLQAELVRDDAGPFLRVAPHLKQISDGIGGLLRQLEA